MEKGRYAHLGDCACNMIRQSARLITQHHKNFMRDIDVTPTQFSILVVLANTGPIQMTHLAERLLLERTGLTRNLAVMEGRGWVQIEIGDKDVRQRIVSLTTCGFDLLDLAIPQWEKAQSSITALLGENALENLRGTLSEMNHKLGV